MPVTSVPQLAYASLGAAGVDGLPEPLREQAVSSCHRAAHVNLSGCASAWRVQYVQVATAALRACVHAGKNISLACMLPNYASISTASI